MQVKVQTVVHGVAQDIFIDANRDWVAIQFTAEERRIIAALGDNQVFIAAPIPQIVGNRDVVMKWAGQWPTRFWSGSHKAPEGALLLPDNSIVKQDGN